MALGDSAASERIGLSLISSVVNCLCFLCKRAFFEGATWFECLLEIVSRHWPSLFEKVCESGNNTLFNDVIACITHDYVHLAYTNIRKRSLLKITTG